MFDIGNIKEGQRINVDLDIKTVAIDTEDIDDKEAELITLLKNVMEQGFADDSAELDKILADDSTNEIRLMTEAYLTVSQEGNIEIVYTENEDDPQIASLSKIIFSPQSPNIVSMTKSGAIKTFLSFETGKTHVCTYDTPYMPFRVYVDTKKADNRLLSQGKLHLNYVICVNDTPPQHFLVDVTMREQAR